MEKSILLSKTAFLALLIVVAACLPFSLAARAPAVTVLEAAPVPVDGLPPTAKSCSTVKDCKGVTCDSVIWHVECIDGSCHCIPNAPESEPVPVDDVVEAEAEAEPEPIDDAPVPAPITCSTSKDCAGITCGSVLPIIRQVKCDDGICVCVPSEPTQAEQART